ncbi:MAG: hypothetical protein EOP08_17870 [Proteobacteria bacterium]|nr:MAG: hypothetical protein EOP08_17870 [Pseudomonadota bacterium]
MRSPIRTLALLILSAASGWPASTLAQQGPAARLVEQVAEAMGGRERLRTVDTLVYTGFGQDAYMDGGGNVTAERDAPPSM